MGVLLMATRFLFPVLLLVATVAITACISPQAPPRSPVQPSDAMTTVKVAYLPVVSNGPLFMANDEGYFAEQGIRVEFVKFQSASAALPALVHGDIAVSGGSVSPSLIKSIADGVHIRIVADKGRNSPGPCNASGIMVRTDLVERGELTRASDLKGKRIMASSDQAYRVYRILKMGNLTTDDVEIVNMDFASGVVALRNGAIDAGDLTEPYVTNALDDKVAVMLFPTEIFSPDYPTPLYYGPEILDRDPEIGRRFMVAYLKGVRQYNLGKTDRNIGILANYTHLDPDLLKRSCWLPIDPSGDFPRKPVRDYLDWMQANGKIRVAVSDDQLFDMSYVNYANIVLRNASPEQ